MEIIASLFVICLFLLIITALIKAFTVDSSIKQLKHKQNDYESRLLDDIFLINNSGLLKSFLKEMMDVIKQINMIQQPLIFMANMIQKLD